MKKVVTVGIGGKSFVIDEDAYNRLSLYLSKFKERTKMGVQTPDVMEDLEARIAELFSEALGARRQVINITIVNSVISQLGMPDGGSMEDVFNDEPYTDYQGTEKVRRRLYRDVDNSSIAGVCSGLAIYLDVDVILVRIIFIVALLVGGTGFWAYIVFWIVAPQARSAAQKCEMRGLPITAENLRKFSSYRH